jgi:DeoR family transcriptional regulator, suf operon transcriptional repressor
MAPIQDDKSSVGETKEKILELLLGGSKSAGEVAEKLQIQKSAARVHLESLKSLGATKSKFQIEKMGRPKKVYELTERGRELFPRKYDLFLNLVLGKIAGKKGEAEAREIVESVAADIASEIRAKIDKSNRAGDIEQSLKIINDASNEMGFASSLSREEKDNNSFCIQSKNCILYKVASNNQDMICHGLHDKIISKSLADGKSNVRVELKECMALGNEYCRHVIRSSRKNNDDD